MRFLPHFLFVLLAAAPALVQAQAVQSPDISSGEPPVAVAASGCGQGYTGFVKSGEKPLAGASVFVKGTNLVLVTNQMGFFVVPASVREWPTISVSAMGYEPVALTYQVCNPLMVNLKVLPGTKFIKHGRKKGFIVSPKRPATRH